MTRLELTLLGPPQISFDGEAIALNERKSLALLIYLVLTAKPHSREALAALFWPESDQSRARANLRYALWSLRKSIGDAYILSEGGQIRFDAAVSLTVDIVEFRRNVAMWREHDDEGELCADCRTALEEAVLLYSDDFLAGFSLDDSAAFDEWQFFEAESCRQDLSAALDALVRYHGGKDDYEIAIEYARRRLTLDPLHEPVHRTLMELYAEAGHRTAALRQYDECVRLLQEELNMDPAEETRRLVRAIRRRVAPGSLRIDPSAKFSGQMRAEVVRLPVARTPFVGRKREVAQVTEMLVNSDSRLVSIIGHGGIGKSRLALQAARSVSAHFADGVCWVSLAGITSAELLPLTILQALSQSVAGIASSRVELLDHLRERAHLLVLDNFEQLLPAAALLGELLEAAPSIKLLVTSRERLHLHHEWILPLDGLSMNGSEPDPTPGDHHEALALLLQCARRYRPELILDEVQADTARAVCRMVGGSPLAIEHVAAWLRATSLEVVREELNRGLGILISDQQDTPERHRSMETVLESSWRILPSEQQALLRQLSLFRSPFTLGAARAVGSADLPTLASLIDASWVQVSGDDHYALHELARQYAYDKLITEHESTTGETSDAVRTRFSRYYAELLHDAEGNYHHAIFLFWKELDSIWAAWDWAVQHVDSAAIAAMARTLFDLCGSGFRHAMMERVRIAISLLRNQPNGRNLEAIDRLALAKLHSIEAHLTALLGSLEESSAKLEKTKAIVAGIESSLERAEALEELILAQAYSTIGLGRYSVIEQILGDHPSQQISGAELVRLHYLAYAAKLQGRLDDAERFMRRQMEAIGASADDFVAHSVDIACDRGDLDEAMACLARQRRELIEAEAAGLSIRYGLQHLTYQIHRGNVAALAGNWDEARTAFEESIDAGEVTGYKLVSIRALQGLGGVELGAGNPEAALFCFEKARNLSQFTARWRNLGIALIGIARAEIEMGRTAAARKSLKDAFSALEQTEAVPIILDLLVAWVELRLTEGEQSGIERPLRRVLAHPATLWTTRQKAQEIVESCDVPLSTGESEPAADPLDVESLLASVERELVSR